MNWREHLILLFGAASPFALGADNAAATDLIDHQDQGGFDPPEIQKDLLLFRDPAERERLLLFAAHRSHSSHSSHRSHSSHYSGSGRHSSHASHFSGSGGYVAPAPIIRAPAPRPPARKPVPATPITPYFDNSSRPAAASTTPAQRLGADELANMVTKVQVALVVRGFKPGPVDGKLGAQTKDALTRFQAANGLPPTGSMDLETLQALGVEIAMPSRPAARVTHPVWMRRPSSQEMARYYPDRAQRMGVAGEAVVTCVVAADGSLDACVLESESPSDMGFGEAALKLATLFRLQLAPGDVGSKISLPIAFAIPL